MSTRRVGFLAAAAALAMPGLSLGQLMQALDSGGAPTGNWRPRYGGKGWSVAEGKRRARKHRNRLRANGQHQRAVR